MDEVRACNMLYFLERKQGEEEIRFKIKPNQRDHLIQWLMVIVVMAAAIFFVPVWLWLKTAVIGLAFFIGFLLRAFKAYPGAHEPLAIDIATAGIAFIFTALFIYLKAPVFQLAAGIAFPFVLLMPHIAYILKNKTIGKPGFRKMVDRMH